MHAYAHRGHHEDVPENTLPAFEAAFREGFSVETDVRTTLDSVPVISHDDSLARVSGVERRISESSLSAVREVSISADDSEEQYSIPTLAELLDCFVETASPEAQLALHVKERPGTAVGEAIVETMDRVDETYGGNLYDRVFVFDTTIPVAEELHSVREALRIGLSVGDLPPAYEAEYPTIYTLEAVEDLPWLDTIWADEWVGDLYEESFFDRCSDVARQVVCISPELHADTVPAHPDAAEPSRTWSRLHKVDTQSVCTDEPIRVSVHGQ